MIIAMGLWFTMLWMPGHMPEGNDMLDDQINADIMPVTSLSGQALRPPTMSPEARGRLETNLASARAAYEADPDDAENIIWLGRRTAYLWGYHEAIQIFTEGLAQHPDSYQLLRHRGHRYISVREFDKAIADLERASELIEGVMDHVEYDGAPNKYNIPTSSNHFNIWYHLGLSYYLIGDFDNALRCFIENEKYVYNFDALVANSDWLYMIYRRMGREGRAAAVLEKIDSNLNILENDAYFKRLLMYRGEISADDLLDLSGGNDLTNELNLVTQGYGVANWYLYTGMPEKGKRILEKILENPYWSAFGYIAAEAELNRRSVQ